MEVAISTYQQFVLDHFRSFMVIIAAMAFGINHFFSNRALLIAKRKSLFAEQNKRSSHEHPTPAFGGVSIFIVVMITLLLVIGAGFDNSIGFTLASCFILFITGLKDDLSGANARTKFLVQILAAFLFVVNPDFALGHLNGFLGIGLMNPNWTYLIGMVFIVSLVNAFNLIDGIDGLSGFTAIISFSVFGVYFYINDHYGYSLFCITLIGALGNFLTFNLGKPGNKLFMGDTGALVVGFLLAIFTLRIVELQPLSPFEGFFPKNAVIFISSVLIIPILDTARVIVIRLKNGQKPWYADRLHMHHVLLDLGYTHKEATARLIGLQLFSIGGYWVVDHIGNLALHLYLIALYTSVIALFMVLNQIKKL